MPRSTHRLLALTLVALPLLLLVSVSFPPAAAAPLSALVKDINPATPPLSSYPQSFTALGSTLFFTAYNEDSGRELWKSDGSAAGTRLVVDLYPGPDGSYPLDLVTVGNTLYFTASGATTGEQLWRSDGTAVGTVPVTTQKSDILGLVATSTTLFFTTVLTSGTALWVSDGTAVGTRQLLSQPPNSFSEFTTVGATLFFARNDRSGGQELWKSDGTPAGTVPIAPLTARFQENYLTAVGDKLFFVSSDGTNGDELWTTDGTTAGTRQVIDLYPGDRSSSPQQLVAVGPKLYFVAQAPCGGQLCFGLWVTDGTAAGTVSLPGSGGATRMVRFGERLLFTPDGNNLWMSDGTPAGTTLFVTPSSGNIRGLTSVGPLVFFRATNGANAELWRTDGTVTGTVRLATFMPETGNGVSQRAAAGALFFSADTGTSGVELWHSDGTAAGTALIANIAPDVASSLPDASTAKPLQITALGKGVLLAADDGVHGDEPWASDGSDAGTTLVQDIMPSFGEDSRPTAFHTVGNTVFFLASNPSNGRRLWKSDGSPPGTGRITSEPAGGGQEDQLVIVGSKLFLGGSTLRVSNGSSDATTLFDRTADLLVGAGNMLFFCADQKSVWKSNGTTAGTQQVATFSAQGYFVTHVTAVGNSAFFTLEDFDRGYGLWKSDGTTAGTVPLLPGFDSLNEKVQDLTAVGATLFFTRVKSNGTELWKSDGTVNSTVRVSSINFNPNTAADFHGVAVGATLFFAVDDGQSGRELWKSDGTDAGTVRVADLVPGAGSSMPTELTNVNGTLLFAAYDMARGYELFRSDGTAAGTGIVQDVNAGSGNSNPGGFTLAGDTVFFKAWTPAVGTELRAVPLAALATILPPATPTPLPPTSTPSTGTPAATPPSTLPTTTPLIFTPNVTAAGGTVRALDGSVSLIFPGGALTTDAQVTITPMTTSTHPLPTGQRALRFFALDATDRAGVPITQFNLPYTLVLSYTDAQLTREQLSEGSLNVAFWNGAAWVPLLPCAGCGVDAANNRITLQLDHFTDFALLGNVQRATYLPLTTR